MAILQDLIPIMTSNTAPSGTASASSYLPGYEPWLPAWGAFAKGFTNYWHSNNWPTPHWLRYQFPSPQVVVGFSFWPRHDVVWSPNTWKFQGSNDASTWVDLHIQSTPIALSATANLGDNPYGNLPWIFWFANTTAYTYYQMTNFGTPYGGTYINVVDFRMYGWAGADYPPIDRGITDGTARVGRIVSLIPPMTGNAAPCGTVSISNVYDASFYPWKAVSGNPADYVHSGNKGGFPGWIKYAFLTPKTVCGYSLRPRPDSNNRHPRNWKLQGSEDGYFWVDLDTQTNQSWSGVAENKRYYFITNSKPFAAYRLYDIYDTTDNNYFTVCDWQLYGYDGNCEDQVTSGLGRTPRRMGALAPQLDNRRRRGM